MAIVWELGSLFTTDDAEMLEVGPQIRMTHRPL